MSHGYNVSGFKKLELSACFLRYFAHCSKHGYKNRDIQEYPHGNKINLFNVVYNSDIKINFN